MGLQRLFYTVPLRLRSILRPAAVERELEDELRFHLDHKIADGMAHGLSPDEARLAALRAMGGLDQRKEEMRDARRIHWLTDAIDDARYALRSLRRMPGLTVFVILTLALGIGMSAAAFSMVDGLILRPYPVAHPSRIVDLVGTSRDNGYDDFSYREYLDLERLAKSYDGIVASSDLLPVGFSPDAAITPRVKAGMLVSGNYFRVLGVEPQAGRGFRDDEDREPGRDAVVVLGPDCWKQEFGADPSVIGKTIRLNGVAFTVIGVAPDTFPGLLLFQRPDFYVPLAMARAFPLDAQRNFFEDRDDRVLSLRARLATDASVSSARGELDVLAKGFARDHAATNRDRGAAVRTLYEMRTRSDMGEWKFIVVFAALSLVVLSVACTNVAGLLLSRGQTRTREIAVRLAIGAGRFRVVRMLLTESLILAALGGVGGVAVAYAAIRFFHAFAIPSELPVVLPFQLDERVLLATLALSVVTAVAFGLVPALQAGRTDLVTGIKTADIDTPGTLRLWGRNALVVAQVSLSLALLTASLVMVRGFRMGLDAGTGTIKDRVLMARFDPRLLQYTPADTERFYRRLVERVTALPGVEGAALTQNPPLGLGEFDTIRFVPEGFVMPRDREAFTSSMDTVDEGFFSTMEIAILRGRAILRSDDRTAPLVAVVNEQFARHYWPDKDAIGEHIRLGGITGPLVEIVGIARTVKYRATYEKPTDFVYLPLAQHPTARVVLLMRSRGDSRELVEPLKAAVHGLDANMPISDLRSYAEVYRYNTVEGPGMGVEVVAAMGVVGLMLSIAGLYGLISYAVSRRTREIGIRMAIGASPANVLRLVMSKGIVLVGMGAVLGLVIGLGLERVLNAFLFNVGGIDVLAYAVVMPVLLVVTLLATYVPARRAAQIEPTRALRCE
jgi:macrolide transport system ATP-binding/permease protein